MQIKPFLVWVMMISLLASCAAPAKSSSQTSTSPVSAQITVMAAASLTDAFEEIGRLYQERHPGVKAVFNFGGSQQLSQQIAQGAPADVFASADSKQMEVAEQSGRVAARDVVAFAHNRLVVILPRSNPAGITRLQDLARPGLKLVIAAEEVPVGSYTMIFLEKASEDAAFGADFKQKVLANVVSYEENVKSVVSKVELGEADGGVVYISDASGAEADKVRQIPIPDALNVSADYPIAVLNDSRHPSLARDFVDLALSADGQAILAKYGFIPVKP
jgi:molybdate transport system substrate-binding protein